MKKSVLAAAVAGASIAGGLVAHRRLLRAWAENPDPLNGRPVAFPDGERRQVVMNDGAVINTVRAGSGPLVVLVHGLTANRHDWGPVAERLIESGCSVLAVDQRGHGDSTTGSDGFGSARLGQDLATVFDTLALADVVLAGHSMGGMAILSMVTGHPETQARLDAMVLVATAPAMSDPKNQVALRLGGTRITDLGDRLDSRLRTGAGLTVFGARPSLHMVDEAVRQYLLCPDDVRRDATAALVGHDVRAQLPDIAVPTHVIAGTRDLLTPLEGNEELAREIPGAELTIEDGAGHMIIWERFDTIADVIMSARTAASPLG